MFCEFEKIANPKRFENEESFNFIPGVAEPCIICGKKIKNPKFGHWLRLIDGGEIITDDDENARPSENAAGEMGWYPCGPDCYKKFLKNAKK
jgi:hypothetical protein